MKIAYIGLGKMGIGMCQQLEEHGHTVIAFNRGEEGRKKGRMAGLSVVETLPEAIGELKGQKVVWLMVTASGVDEVLRQLLPLLSRGDIVVDGGNCFYEDTIRHAKILKKHGIKFLDAGVSGGPGGARNGACVMIGGDRQAFKKLLPIFKAISVPDGFAYFGDHGAGHFVKMVHNGIEYGMMQALAEGFALLRAADFRRLNADRRGHGKRHGLHLTEVARLYNRKSVIESRLVGWLKDGYKKFGEDLKGVSGTVNHTGEGEWTVKTAKKLGIPAPIIKAAFDFRVASAKNPSYTGQILSTLRNQFGGHNFSEKRKVKK